MRGKDSEDLERVCFLFFFEREGNRKGVLYCTRVTFYSIINNIVLISLQVGFHQIGINAF